MRVKGKQRKGKGVQCLKCADVFAFESLLPSKRCLDNSIHNFRWCRTDCTSRSKIILQRYKTNNFSRVLFRTLAES